MPRSLTPEEAARWRDPVTGEFDPYAQRAERRLRADASYLHLRRIHGAQEAARRTCAEHGHDARAGRCDRCGSGVAGRRQ